MAWEYWETSVDLDVAPAVSNEPFTSRQSVVKITLSSSFYFTCSALVGSWSSRTSKGSQRHSSTITVSWCMVTLFSKVCSPVLLALTLPSYSFIRFVIGFKEFTHNRFTVYLLRPAGSCVQEDLSGSGLGSMTDYDGPSGVWTELIMVATYGSFGSRRLLPRWDRVWQSSTCADVRLPFYNKKKRLIVLNS